MGLADGVQLFGAISRVGADWVAPRVEDGPTPVLWIVPLAAIDVLAVTADEVLSSVRGAHPGGALGQRMSLGFVLRDLVRRRVPLTVALLSGRSLSGTVDRAGADHLDIALHEIGAVRRADQVHGFRLIPFAAVAAIRVDAVVELA